MINDRHSTASEIYETKKFAGIEYSLSEIVFPVITTEQVISRLISRLCRIRVSVEDRRSIVAVIEAMGRRADILPHLDGGRWIRNAVRECNAANPECVRVLSTSLGSDSEQS
ncbi:hypothetical protein [Rhodococcus sp. BP22]|uniref:hypothetical protein n=1 Tax=Rhodococcus sp. BP22 TaxID=2758566 RepID=UPI0016466EBB|nr:hypothetical protein [Rhodococcus sp. BP22]